MVSKVTAIIPAYNRAHLLAQSVDCVLNQTHPNCHVLVIDDGSTDTTPALMVERYGGNPRVRYFRKPNGGVSSARNAGISMAQGEYIAFLDSDDLWQPWKIEVQAACLQALSGVGMIWSDMDGIDAAGNVTQTNIMRRTFRAFDRIRIDKELADSSPLSQLVPGMKNPGIDAPVYWGDGFSAMFSGGLVRTSTVLMTQELVQATGRFDESMNSGEDYDYFLRAASKGNVALLDLSTTLYRTGVEDQLTRSSRHSLDLAENCLKTIRAFVEIDGARRRLPERVVRRRLATTHRWIGMERTEKGDNQGARANFITSLRLWPWQPRTWLVLAAVLGGAGFTRFLRNAWRKLRGRD